MYKIIIIAEPQKDASVNLVDLDKKVTVKRVVTYQPQLIDCLKSFADMQEVEQIDVYGPKVYTAKIVNDITKQFPQTEVKEIN